eukprot:7379517-Prymnesium_polylepis.1
MYMCFGRSQAGKAVSEEGSGMVAVRAAGQVTEEGWRDGRGASRNPRSHGRQIGGAEGGRGDGGGAGGECGSGGCGGSGGR